MELNLKELNDLYYVVGRMMVSMKKEDRVFIKDEELEVLSDRLRELIEVRYKEDYKLNDENVKKVMSIY
jgi:hypothetical protein